MTRLAWTLDPLELALLALVIGLYARRYARLRQRGRAPSRWRPAAFTAGMLVLALALVSPIDGIGEQRLLSVHVLQHLMLGDIGPLLIVLGLTGTLLRPVIALPYLGRLRALAHPAIALTLWTIVFSGWHLPVFYDAALAHPSIHALEHATFVVSGMLMWAALLEPLPGPSWFTTGWKLGYLTVLRLVQATVANALLFDDTPLYNHYLHVRPLWGLSPSNDQNIAGAVILLEGMFVLLALYGWALARFFTESETRQALLEQGVGQSRADRAARHGRHISTPPPVGHADERPSRRSTGRWPADRDQPSNAQERREPRARAPRGPR